MTGKQKGDTEAIIKRVSRKHGEGEHGGAWKVAFADFCLALMCLFLVLWVMAAREQERIEEWMRAAGGDLLSQSAGRMMESMGGPRGSLISREPLPKGEGGNTSGRDSGLPTRSRYESPADMQELAQFLARLSEQAGLAGNLQTVITPYGLRIMVHDTDRQGMFDRSSAIVNERFRGLLRKIGGLFARIENQLLIVGHTDAVQYASRAGSSFSNWTLSSQRAMAAKMQLLEGGMATDSILQVVGMAERAPIEAADPKAAVNRRIELLLLTTVQAEAVAAMFGMPRETGTLIDGIDVAIPDHAALQDLQYRLRQERNGVRASRENSGK